MERTEVVEPRPEARPLHWSEMTQEQQDATRRLGTFIRRLAEASFKPMPAAHDTHGFLPPIDTTRRNNVFLFDGGRGSGKTALVVTHLDVWSWGVRNKPKDHAGGVPEEGIQNELEPLGQVVPVGLLDLQPLPKGANLLVYIASRFKRVVEAVQRMTGHTQVTKPWHAADPETAKSARQWRMFMNAAAAGWEGSLEGRRAMSDPAAFAVEFEESEDQRLEVIPQFRRLIDALVVDYARLQGWPENKLPLFVLGIDDADMNVQRSTEVLDVIRALWHPRIAFVLTGDSELFEAALEVRTENELAAPSRKIVASGERLVRTLPRDIYNKIIPPLHRFELRPLFPGERRRLLNDWLSKVEGKRARDRIAKAQALFDIYPLLETALPGRLRPLQDFALWVGTIQDDKDVVDEGLVEARVLHYLWKSALHENLLPELKTWVVEDDQRRIVLKPDRKLEAAFVSSKRTYFVNDKLPRFRLSIDWRVDIQEQNEVDDEENQAHPLPEKLTACLIPMFDLRKLVKNPWLVARTALVIPEPRNFAPVSIQLENGGAWLRWPVPQWPTLAQSLLFANCWIARVNAIMANPLVPRVMIAWAFFDSVLDTALGREHAIWAEKDPGRRRVDALKFIKEDPGSSVPLKDWVRVDAPRLAAPESGLDATDANDWLNAVRSIYTHAEWREVCTSILQHRRIEFARLNKASKQGVEAKLRQIESQSSYNWFREVERDPAMIFGALLQAMNQIRVPGNRTAGTLRSYLPKQRAALLLQEAPMDQLERLQNALVQLANQPGSAGIAAIEQMWKIVTKDEPEDLQAAVSYHGTLTLNVEVAYKHCGRPRVDIVPASRHILDTKDKTKIPLGVSQGRQEWNASKNIDETIRIIMQIAWDIESDTKDATLSPFDPWWPLAYGHCGPDSNQRYPWPMPVWTTFLDWERLVDRWNENVQPQVVKLAEQAAKTGGSAAIYSDAAAFWYVTTLEHMSLHRCDLTHIDFELHHDPKQWRRIVSDWFVQKGISSNTKETYRKVFYDWVENVGLLAAPESGLSQDVAQAILEAIPDLAHRQKALADLRRARARAIGVATRSVEPTLRAIDADFQKHPWIRLIENPLAQETATPKPPKS